MRPLLGLAASAVGLCAATAAFAAPSVEIGNAVARVIVSPEPRDDVRVDIIRPNPRLKFKVWTFAGRTYIDGGLWNRLRGCGLAAGQPIARVLGLHDISYSDMPQIVIRTPMDARVSSGGEVWGQIGRSNTLELANTGCAAWTAAAVRGRLKISQTGSGATRTGAAGGATLSATGSGSIATGAVTGAVAAMNLGSGDIDIARLDGPLNVRIAGSGKVRVASGRATTMQASIAGSGDVTMNGVAGSLSASVMGSGNVRVAKVNGPVNQSVMGSGTVRIGS
ncbi:MAG TPA: DUF2807 domain-containing protein [Caulobacteraceae bacterium]|jgi:hypothetical protein|nr:DUF2807 domain-containing protein [Caulobacteraceae bacterium]